MRAEQALQNHVDDLMCLKYHAAKRIWPIHDEAAAGTDETWAQWFERVYHEPLDAYAKRAKEQGLRDRVRVYEVATYGRSTLEERSNGK